MVQWGIPEGDALPPPPPRGGRGIMVQFFCVVKEKMRGVSCGSKQKDLTNHLEKPFKTPCRRISLRTMPRKVKKKSDES